ncbi:MAG TPA: protein phosphatase 2C domain-containing protein, partial [Ignavibacteriaceae bacterium]
MISILDHHSIVGVRHVKSSLPCQDSTKIAQSPEEWWMAVSDGCSGNGVDRTEDGSRMLTEAAWEIWKKGQSKGNIDKLGTKIW